jgi:hypothetical protein
MSLTFLNSPLVDCCTVERILSRHGWGHKSYVKHKWNDKSQSHSVLKVVNLFSKIRLRSLSSSYSSSFHSRSRSAREERNLRTGNFALFLHNNRFFFIHLIFSGWHQNHLRRQNKISDIKFMAFQEFTNRKRFLLSTKLFDHFWSDISINNFNE